jgi:hypothetical protein
MIRKVYEVDRLVCPKCQGQMRIIAFINIYEMVGSAKTESQHKKVMLPTSAPKSYHNVNLVV